MKKKWIIASLVVATAGLACVGMARPDGRRGPSHDADGFHGFGKAKFMTELGLNDEQIDQLQQVKFETQKQVIPMRAERQLAQLDLRQALEAETPDEAAVLKALERGHAVHLEIRKAQVLGLLKAREIAGPEAWEAFKEKVGDRIHERVRQFREGHPRRRGEDRPDRGPRRGFRGPGGPGGFDAEEVDDPGEGDEAWILPSFEDEPSI